MKKEPILSLKDVSVQYGGIQALDRVSIDIGAGEIVALMGPNGAGKSTVIKALFGLAPITHGSVHLYDQKITPVAHEMISRGIAYIPQGRQVFKHLTVYENLELGGYVLRNQKDVARSIEGLLNLFPTLREKLNAKAGSLSGGQQQLLTIARGLVSNPRIVLLDEPSLGLSPKIVKEVFALIKQINSERDIAVLVVEHSIKSVLSIADRAYVLAHGKVALHKDHSDEIDEQVLEKIFLTA